MIICPKCNRHHRGLQKVVVDKESKKKWMITYCGGCRFNSEIEEYKGEDTTAGVELAKLEIQI